MTPAGIVLCVIIILALIAVIFYLFWKKRNGNNADDTEKSADTADACCEFEENIVSEKSQESGIQEEIPEVESDIVASEEDCGICSELIATEAQSAEEVSQRIEMPADQGEILLNTESIEQDPNASRTTEEYTQWVKAQSGETSEE